MLFDVEERSSSFFDDLDEKQMLDEVRGIGAGLQQDILPKQDSEQTEASFYGLDHINNLD